MGKVLLGVRVKPLSLRSQVLALPLGIPPVTVELGGCSQPLCPPPPPALTPPLPPLWGADV